MRVRRACAAIVDNGGCSNHPGTFMNFASLVQRPALACAVLLTLGAVYFIFRN